MHETRETFTHTDPADDKNKNGKISYALTNIEHCR